MKIILTIAVIVIVLGIGLALIVACQLSALRGEMIDRTGLVDFDHSDHIGGSRP